MGEPSSQAGHRAVDHTGDVAIELWAPTEPALLCEAARATVALMTEAAPGATDHAGGGGRARVLLDTLDREDRLVQWVNEVIFLAVSEGLLVAGADIDIDDRGDGGVVSAELRLSPLPPSGLDTELKSATYHDLRVERGDDGWYRARVVIDV